MYCSTCGKTITPGLSYCNHCGARLADKADEVSGRMPESSFNLLIIGLFGVPIAGLGVIIGLLTVMKKELGLNDNLIGIVMLLAFSLLVIAELGLIWLLWSNSRSVKRAAKKQTQATLPSQDVVMRGLPESRHEPIDQPIPSVTEHTTRTLDAVPRRDS